MNRLHLPAAILAALAFAGAIPLYAQKDDAAAFWAAMRASDRAADRQQALAILESARRQFPAREFEITLEMAAAYAQLGQCEKSMEIWQAGHRKGLFYGLLPQIDWLKPFAKFPQFQSILDRDKELREQADRTGAMRYEAVLPAGYSASRKYPLFIVLHAGGDSIDGAKDYWRSAALSRDYLAVFLESGRHRSSKTYTWPSRDPEIRAGVRKLYDEIVAKYPVDTSRVLVGGMSAGGMMSLDVVFHDVIPVTGFVVNCPVVPPDFEPAMAERLQQRGVRGVVITGEQDWGLPRQKEMIEAFTKARVPHLLVVVPGMGHDVPDDFPSRLDAALAELAKPAPSRAQAAEPQPKAARDPLQITYIANDAPPADFTADKWDLKNADVKEYLGRRALSGSAVLKEVSFENGVVEFDFVADHTRSYPGLSFRMQSEGEYERVYFRPHRAGHYSDAIQYVPAFHGVDGWQLYNGDGYTAGVTLPVNEWVHVRIEVMDTQARVFVGGEARPALFIRDLKHGKSRGGLALEGPRRGSTYFSNFTYDATAAPRFDPPRVPEPPLGVIAEWSLSQPFRAILVDPEKTPDAQGLKDIQWQKVHSEPSGLVDIARYVQPFVAGPSAVFAKTTIRSAKDETRKLAFGYSDAVTIFLNGKILFNGSSEYQQRDASFLGIVGLNDSVYLPLRKGDNELTLLVRDSFGGWGLMCRDVSAVYQHPALTELWALPNKLRMPESVAYDAKRNVLYVSNLRNDGKEFVSKLGINGEILALEWVAGLSAPTGVRIHNDRLYVVERPGVAEIDIDAGKIVRRIPIPGAGFINDLSLDGEGVIYVTDSSQNKIYKIAGGQVETWLQGDSMAGANGILVEKDRLLVGTSGDASIKAIELTTKKMTTFVTLDSGSIMDGLVADGSGGYIISDFRGRVYRVQAGGGKTLLLDLTGPRRFCADLEYIPEKGLLVIPSLLDNRIMTYRYRP